MSPASEGTPILITTISLIDWELNALQRDPFPRGSSPREPPLARSGQKISMRTETRTKRLAPAADKYTYSMYAHIPYSPPV
jgi:hypothetical protein